MLDHSRLENVRVRNGKTIARCPACAEGGGDSSSGHLAIFPDGRFACAARAGDHEHRRRIHELAGLPCDRKVPLSHAKIPRRNSGGVPAPRRKEIHWRQLASCALGEIIEGWHWGEADAWEASPLRLNGDYANDWRLLLQHLYPNDDVLWVGDKYQSGKPEHLRYFRPVREWLAADACDGPLICPGTFAPGSYSRSDSNILARRYLVLDGDTVDARCAQKNKHKEPLNAEDKRRNFTACLALYHWLLSETNLVLRAIVDAANKSAHAWLDFPDADTLEYLRVIVSSLGLDPATLRDSQPVRLPGVRRPDTGRWQRLLFLNPIQQP